MEDHQHLFAIFTKIETFTKLHVKNIRENFCLLKILSRIVSFRKSPISMDIGIYLYQRSLQYASSIGLPSTTPFMMNNVYEVDNLMEPSIFLDGLQLLTQFA